MLLVLAGPAVARAAVSQAWPPFALVAGLLLIGCVAGDDGVFAAAGAWIAGLRAGPVAMLGGLLGLVALTTVVLNLDTAVVFLTPVLAHAARARRLPEAPFVYGAVFMSNAASLLLPGSNLTNLLVLDGAGASGLEFARRMAAPWAVSVVLIAAMSIVWLRRSPPAARGRPAPHTPSTGTARRGLGIAVITGAGMLVLALRDAALPVLLLALTAATLRAFPSRTPARVLGSLPLTLVALFAVTVAVGVAARVWPVPSALSAAATPAQSVLLAAACAGLLNNLPAAAALSAHMPAHPLFLLLGLNLGPNLCITGSLAAVLWWRSARHAGARVSVRTYTRVGLVVGPLGLLAAAAALALAGPVT